jgi:acylphosphatase
VSAEVSNLPVAAVPDPMPRERRRVYFSGRVQGVGFRYTCSRLAYGFAVGGYVRNLPDGRVEVLAEGETAELDTFLAALKREMDGYIRDVAVEPEPPGILPLCEFTIRH